MVQLWMDCVFLFYIVLCGGIIYVWGEVFFKLYGYGKCKFDTKDELGIPGFGDVILV